MPKAYTKEDRIHELENHAFSEEEAADTCEGTCRADEEFRLARRKGAAIARSTVTLLEALPDAGEALRLAAVVAETDATESDAKRIAEILRAIAGEG